MLAILNNCCSIMKVRFTKLTGHPEADFPTRHGHGSWMTAPLREKSLRMDF